MADRPVACEDWQPALAGWLVAQLPPQEEAMLAAHLAACATCRAEAESLFDVAAVTLGVVTGLRATSELPPADLGDRIAARVALERRARRVGRLGLVLTGAAAAVVAGVLVTRNPGEPPLRGEPVAFARESVGVDASAVVAPDGSGSIMELHVSGLDPDTTYAMWLTPPGGDYEDRVAAGTFRPDEDGEVEVRLRCPLPPEDMGRAWATTPQGEITLDTEAR